MPTTWRLKLAGKLRIHPAFRASPWRMWTGAATALTPILALLSMGFFTALRTDEMGWDATAGIVLFALLAFGAVLRDPRGAGLLAMVVDALLVMVVVTILLMYLSDIWLQRPPAIGEWAAVLLVFLAAIPGLGGFLLWRGARDHPGSPARRVTSTGRPSMGPPHR